MTHPLFSPDASFQCNFFDISLNILPLAECSGDTFSGSFVSNLFFESDLSSAGWWRVNSHPKSVHRKGLFNNYVMLSCLYAKFHWLISHVQLKFPDS